MESTIKRENLSSIIYAAANVRRLSYISVVYTQA